MGMDNDAATYGNRLTVLDKVEHAVAYDPGNPFLGIYSRELNTYSYPNLCTNVHSSCTY